MPARAVTRPPPTAGPRLRNFMLASGSLLLGSAGEFCPGSFCATAKAGNRTTIRSAQALRHESDFISFTPGKFLFRRDRRPTQTALRGRAGALVAQNSFDLCGHESRGNKGAITYHI